ncbi:hypothetical protein M9H77_04412 [Catharanthus roseus]|uniref:Uncharacterized protein n=1 Tax=Catharanthus roseus TaxID=4058 RepID=A0ACC0CE63_CATRO|nr:hypothetical protein M9H77_04412 [Catharanthus roseus]
MESQDDVVEVEMDEVNDLVVTMGYAFVGYIVGGFPGIEAISKLRNTWRVHDKFHVHKSACTHSVLPVWVTLLGLPINLWNERVLAKICLKIRELLCTDSMIAIMERISYARVLVEVDVAKELTMEISIKLPNGKMRSQHVVYENLPKYCPSCQVIGHSLEMCRKKEKPQSSGKATVPDPTSGLGRGDKELYRVQQCLDCRNEASDRGDQMLSTLALNSAFELNLAQTFEQVSQDSNRLTVDQSQGGKSPTTKGLVEVQTGEKRALKKITPIPVDKGQKKTLSKDRGKIAVGKNDATALERRKGVSLHFA